MGLAMTGSGTTDAGAAYQEVRQQLQRTVRPAAPSAAGSTWKAVAQEGQTSCMVKPRSGRRLWGLTVNGSKTMGEPRRFAHNGPGTFNIAFDVARPGAAAIRLAHDPAMWNRFADKIMR
jgi:hypothetical protein